MSPFGWDANPDFFPEKLVHPALPAWTRAAQAINHLVEAQSDLLLRVFKGRTPALRQRAIRWPKPLFAFNKAKCCVRRSLRASQGEGGVDVGDEIAIGGRFGRLVGNAQ